MDNSVRYMKLYDGVDKVVSSLEALHSTIATINLGMIMENVDKQTLDCLASINLCIDEIRRTADECLAQVVELQKNNEGNNEA